MSAVTQVDASPTHWLHVLHETAYDYDAPVELAHHVGHLRPRDSVRQRVHRWSLSVRPQPDAVWTESRDVWGNHRVGFSHSRVHKRLLVVSDFVVALEPAVALQAALSPPWESVAQRLSYRPGSSFEPAMEFSLGSHYAPRDAALARFAQEVFRPGTPLLAGAMALMHLIFQRFEYRPHATSVGTRALEALAQRQGVCQDFAHVMIGAMRSLGLAARYVSGYLLTHPPEGQPRLIGADASHAWVSVWCPHHGWVALDPTNAIVADTDPVTLAWGRDYADVAPLRGVIRGGGRATPRVAVTVEPLAEVVGSSESREV